MKCLGMSLLLLLVKPQLNLAQYRSEVHIMASELVRWVFFLQTLHQLQSEGVVPFPFCFTVEGTYAQLAASSGLKAGFLYCYLSFLVSHADTEAQSFTVAGTIGVL